MAERNKDLLSQLADLSESAIQKLAEAPGADKVLQALKGLGDRIDELQRRTKGYEELERRLSALEKKVSGLAKSSGEAAGSSAGARSMIRESNSIAVRRTFGSGSASWRTSSVDVFARAGASATRIMLSALYRISRGIAASPTIR